jgi:hypothetical protein
MRGWIVSIFVVCFSVQAIHGQQALQNFGKNRIQYKVFNWQYISSENFDIYYYDERRKVATEAMQYLESEFDRITDLIGYPPYLKTKIFLYNSITDLQQSNIGLNHTQFNVGGETEFIKPYVEIAHPGNSDDFKEELIYKITDLMINEMMFGGSLKDMFQNAVLLNLPEWFIDGGTNYVAKGWNAEMDDYVRQLVRSKKVNRALKLDGKDAALVGQSIWNFIVEKYGKSSVSNILNYTRVIRNEQKSVLITLGISFKQLMNDWQQFYSDMEKRVAQSYLGLDDSVRFTPRHHNRIVYTTVKISPDGKKIAYAENDRGKFWIKVKSLENGKETTILSSGNKVIKQDVDYHVPLLGWADANTLGVIGVRKGEYVFWLYDLTTKSKLPRELDKFSNIRNFGFSGNGRLAIVSADFEGQNDLFLISSRRDRTKRLTNDIFDDLDPSFIPNSNSIVFTSNRTTDTVNTFTKGYSKITKNYNLYVYNLDTTTNIVKQITNTIGKDTHPVALNENDFFYLSDQRGIVNLFRFNRQTGIYSQISNFNSGIKDYHLEFGTRQLAIVMNQKLKEDIFLIKNFNYDRQVFTPATRRKEVQQVKAITEKKKQEVTKGMSIKDLINSRLKEKNDSTRKEEPKQQPKEEAVKKDTVNTENYSFDDEPVKSQRDTIVVPKQDEKTVNTEDYSFEEEAVKAKQPSETFLTRYLKAKETTRINGPFPYDPKFSYENLITNFVVDPLRGFSVRLETQMNDMLENYRFFGGIQTAFDFKSGDVYGEIQYLPLRVDFSARVDRKVIFWDQGVNLQKYSYQKIEFGASLPLSVRTRVTLKPFGGFTRFVDRGNNSSPTTPPVFLPAKQQFYAGVKSELIYDNSLTTGLNIIEGTRGKITFIHHEALGNQQSSFSQASIDVRHYQKIYKEIVFAVRGYTGTFFGNSPKKYVLGGMDNWFGNRTNLQGIANPIVTSEGFNPNLLFVEFATSLRGFDYATLYGNSVAMANAELRVPLIRALTSGPISSNFFRNMQLTAFYDIGTSWTGAPPFTAQNSVRNRIVPEVSSGSPFRVEVKEYLNPWLYSYGVGFRTMMLGYYMKFDLAWPVENYTVQNPRLHVTLGFDF